MIIRMFLLFCCCFSLATASTQNAGGLLFGENYAYSLNAAPGWVLDNEAAVQEGIQAVFYPKTSTWAEAPAVMYSQARPKIAKINTVDALVMETIKKFHAEGAIKYQGKEVSPPITAAQSKARVFHFSGDEWGNYEAVAYFEEKKTFNFIVLNSKNKKDFEKALPAFEAVVKSYVFLGEKPPVLKEK